MEKFEKIIQFDAAYDKRHKDPKKNYGIHGVTLRFVLKGEKGAINFVVYTNWMLPHIEKEQEAKGASSGVEYRISRPMPADLGYHSYVPQYEGQETMTDECPWLDGKPCYYDGSTLYAETVFKVLVEDGGDALWEKLEQEYNERFETK